MARYQDVIASYPPARLGRFRPLTPDQVLDVQQRWPALPTDYVEFLGEVGYGSLGDGCYMIYSGPIPADEVYSGLGDELDGIVLVGDDFHGYCLGFDPASEWTLIEVGPAGQLEYLNVGFEWFVRSKFAESCR